MEKENVKEEFCGACAAGVSALLGGATSAGSKGIKNKKTKKIIFWAGVSISVISIIYLIYMLFVKNCGECR